MKNIALAIAWLVCPLSVPSTATILGGSVRAALRRPLAGPSKTADRALSN
jgi:hypothetical protein